MYGHVESSPDCPGYKCPTFSPYDRSPFYSQLSNVTNKSFTTEMAGTHTN